MLTPSAATSLATTPNAEADTGLPSTTMVCVDGSRSTGKSLLRSIVTSKPTSQMAFWTSSRTSLPPGTSMGATTSTARVSLPRTTTCSTFSSST